MTLFNNQSYIDDKGDIFSMGCCARRFTFKCLSWYDIFIRHEDETYSRFDESHFQRTFDEKTYLSWLAQVGFKHVETFTDFNIDEHNEDAERLFSLRKNKSKTTRSDVYKVEEWFYCINFYYAIKIF